MSDATSLPEISGRNTLQADLPPGVSLPAGTISYGTNARPSMGQAVDSSIPPNLTPTKDAFVYQTSYGIYSFNRASPFLYSLFSRSGESLVKTGFFFVNSTLQLIPGPATVMVANDTQFKVRYAVLSGQFEVGTLVLQIDFQMAITPKFTISFAKNPLSMLGDFNIVWSTLTAHNFLKTSSSPTVNLQALASPQTFASLHRVETGPESDPSLWTHSLITDWSDAGNGTLKAGFIKLAGRSGFGHTVVFDKNVAIIDPTQVSTSTATFATAYSTQRKTFSYAGYYFLFFYDGSNIVFQSSQDGIHWSPTFIAVNGPISSYSFDLYQSGMNLALAWLNYNSGAGGDGTTQLLFRKGVIVGSSVSWISVATVASWSQPYSWPPSVAIGTDGTFWAAGIWYDSGSNYNIWIYKSTDGASFTLSTNYYTSSSNSRDDALQLIVLPQGKLMALSSHYYDTTIRYTIWNPISPSGASWSSIQNFNVNLQSNTPKWNLVSAVSTNDGFVHLISQKYTGVYSIQYSYFNFTSGLWVNGSGPIQGSGTPVYPSIASDSLGNLHAFWTYNNASGVTRDFWYSFRPSGALSNWAGGTLSLPFGTIKNATWISANRFSSKEVMLAWTQPTSSINKIFYGSIPLHSGVASSPPNRPWSRLGLSPYEQYFVQNGEYVSPGNGLLTVSQTDLSVPGRNGLSFSLTRVYGEPFSFIQGNPFNYESSPIANLGNGWQLNLPWLNNPIYNQGEVYLHF